LGFIREILWPLEGRSTRGKGGFEMNLNCTSKQKASLITYFCSLGKSEIVDTRLENCSDTFPFELFNVDHCSKLSELGLACKQIYICLLWTLLLIYLFIGCQNTYLCWTRKYWAHYWGYIYVVGSIFEYSRDSNYITWNQLLEVCQGEKVVAICITIWFNSTIKSTSMAIKSTWMIVNWKWNHQIKPIWFVLTTTKIFLQKYVN